MGSDQLPEVMNIEQAAAYLEVSQGLLYRLASARKIPGRKVGNKWRFHKTALAEWLKGDKQDNENT